MNPIENAIKQAMALKAQGRADEAIELLRRSVQREPGLATLHHALAAMLFEAGRLDQAGYHAERACELLKGAPTEIVALNTLGAVRHAAGNLEGALRAYSSALAKPPRRPDVLRNYARLLGEVGRIEDACAALREALASVPPGPSRRVFQQELAQALNYLPGISPAAIWREHEALGGMLGTSGITRKRTREPGPIRVGYLSGDFRTHSVAFFFEPLLQAHDPQRVHVTCYATTSEEDAVTARLKGLAHAWRNIARTDDRSVLAQLESDRIDVLVDLAGLTVGHRLGVLVHTTCPVVASFLGYPNTTGIANVDFRLVDTLTDPPELDAAAPIAEQRFRLDRPIWSWRPPLPSPPAASERVDAGQVDARPVTFASFNTITKVNLELLDLWGAILAQTPGSRLVLKGKGFTSRPAREHILGGLARHNVEASRIELIERTASLAEHLSLYHKADIALDTFPYHGTTTTCEALWMGLPVVTLAGATHASRVGVSILRALAPRVPSGVDDLIAQTPEAYVKAAVTLASDAGRRAVLKSAVSQALLASPLCDAPGLARALEGAYAAMLKSKGLTL